jgi:site-specific DNA-methyltransferase (adenine-specific)
MKPYYADESVTLYHGDCREVPEWLAADVLVTDPPYGVAYSSGWDNQFRDVTIANDATVEVRDETLAAWGDKAALVFGSWKMPRPAAVRAVLTWDKGTVGMGALDLPWFPCTEEIYVLGRGWQGSRTSAVMRHVGRNRDHPTEKPVALMLQLVAKCPPGTVADPFAGSGSTLVAAKQLGRRAIGVEIEERYCEIAARRLSQGVLDFGEGA